MKSGERENSIHADLAKVLCVQKSYVLKLACPLVQYTNKENTIREIRGKRGKKRRCTL